MTSRCADRRHESTVEWCAHAGDRSIEQYREGGGIVILGRDRRPERAIPVPAGVDSDYTDLYFLRIYDMYGDVDAEPLGAWTARVRAEAEWYMRAGEGSVFEL